MNRLCYPVGVHTTVHESEFVGISLLAFELIHSRSCIIETDSALQFQLLCRIEEIVGRKVWSFNLETYLSLNLQSANLRALCCNNDDTICTARTVDGSCRCILHYVDRLNLIIVIVHEFCEGNLKTIDDDERSICSV